MRLANVDALLEQTELICTRYEVRWTDNRVMAWIDNAPTVDAVPVVHGYWIERFNRDRYDFRYTCSVCNNGSNLTTDYCPNCGAKMDGDANET